MCEIEFISGRRVCDQTSSIPACQLCPDSPHYHRNPDRPDTNPWATSAALPPDQPRVDLTVSLNWGSSAPVKAAVGPPRPCAECGKPTILTSPPSKRYPKGRSIHKHCAEAWHRAHPTALPNSPGSLI